MMTCLVNVAETDSAPCYETQTRTETVWATGPPTARVKARHRFNLVQSITNVHLPIEWANVDFSSMADMPIIPRA
tara:strand:- start:158 stop:382 length:225 start_codon:yes stop_codon:yes gene_type:complete